MAAFIAESKHRGRLAPVPSVHHHSCVLERRVTRWSSKGTSNFAAFSWKQVETCTAWVKKNPHLQYPAHTSSSPPTLKLHAHGMPLCPVLFVFEHVWAVSERTSWVRLSCYDHPQHRHTHSRQIHTAGWGVTSWDMLRPSNTSDSLDSSCYQSLGTVISWRFQHSCVGVRGPAGLLHSGWISQHHQHQRYHEKI